MPPEETRSSIHTKIRGHIENLFAIPEGRTVVYNNEEYKPEPMSIWLRVTIKDSEHEPATLGKEPNRIMRNSGLIMIQIFSPVGVGAFVPDSIFDSINALFSNKTMDSIRYGSCRVTDRVDADFYQVNINIPFSIDYKG